MTLLWSVCWVAVASLVPPASVNAQCPKFEFPQTERGHTADNANYTVTVAVNQRATIPFSLNIDDCSDRNQVFTITVSKWERDGMLFKDVCKLRVNGGHVSTFNNTCKAEGEGRYSLVKRVDRSDRTLWRWRATYDGASTESFVRFNVTFSSTTSDPSRKTVGSPEKTSPTTGGIFTSEPSKDDKDNDKDNDKDDDNDDGKDDDKENNITKRDEDEERGPAVDIAITIIVLIVVVVALPIVGVFLLSRRYRIRFNSLCRLCARRCGAAQRRQQHQIRDLVVYSQPELSGGHSGSSQRVGEVTFSHPFQALRAPSLSPSINMHQELKEDTP